MDHEKTKSELIKESNGFIYIGNDQTDQGYEYEDYIVADQLGLELLRDKITEVLETGEASSFEDSDVDSDFSGVTLGNNLTKGAQNGGTKGVIGCTILILILAAIIIVFVQGLVRIVEILF